MKEFAKLGVMTNCTSCGSLLGEVGIEGEGVTRVEWWIDDDGNLSADERKEDLRVVCSECFEPLGYYDEAQIIDFLKTQRRIYNG